MGKQVNIPFSVEWTRDENWWVGKGASICKMFFNNGESQQTVEGYAVQIANRYKTIVKIYVHGQDGKSLVNQFTGA